MSHLTQNLFSPRKLLSYIHASYGGFTNTPKHAYVETCAKHLYNEQQSFYPHTQETIDIYSKAVYDLMYDVYYACVMEIPYSFNEFHNQVNERFKELNS